MKFSGKTWEKVMYSRILRKIHSLWAPVSLILYFLPLEDNFESIVVYSLQEQQAPEKKYEKEYGKLRMESERNFPLKMVILQQCFPALNFRLQQFSPGLPQHHLRVSVPCRDFSFSAFSSTFFLLSIPKSVIFFLLYPCDLPMDFPCVLCPHTQMFSHGENLRDFDRVNSVEK